MHAHATQNNKISNSDLPEETEKMKTEEDL